MSQPRERSRWYLAREGRAVPVSSEQLRQLSASGGLRREDRVGRQKPGEASIRWTEAEKVKNLPWPAATSPPPLPELVPVDAAEDDEEEPQARSWRANRAELIPDGCFPARNWWHGPYLIVQMDRIPAVCVRCGERATGSESPILSWMPAKYWLIFFMVLWGCGGIPAAFVVILLMNKVQVRLPLCDAHQGYFSRRRWALLGTTWGGPAVLFLLVILLAVSAGGKGGDIIAGLFCLSTFVVLLAWVAALPLLYFWRIRAVRIDRNGDRVGKVVLTGVSPRYAEAIRRRTRVAEAEDSAFPLIRLGR